MKKKIMTILIAVLAIGLTTSAFAVSGGGGATGGGDGGPFDRLQNMINAINIQLQSIISQLAGHDDRITDLESSLFHTVGTGINLEFREASVGNFEIGKLGIFSGDNNVLSADFSLFATHTQLDPHRGGERSVNHQWVLHEGAVVELYSSSPHFIFDENNSELICTLTEGDTMSDCGVLHLTGEQPSLFYRIVELGTIPSDASQIRYTASSHVKINIGDYSP